jgi:C4-dicarboxylate-specific signal transduction histidine kinase
MAISLCVLLLSRGNGDPFSWLGRALQGIGSIYLLLSVLALPSESSPLPLLPPGQAEQQRRTYTVAAVTVINAAILRLALLSSLGDAYGFITFYPAVIFASIYGGSGPGLLATVLASAIFVFFIAPPVGSFTLTRGVDGVALFAFLTSSMLILWLVRHLRNTQTQAIRAEMAADFAEERGKLILELISKNNDLTKNKALSTAILESIAASMAVIDKEGVVISVNSAWEDFSQANGGSKHRTALGIGTNYLDTCKRSIDGQHEEAEAALNGIKGVLEGQAGIFQMEYSCNSPDENRWFLMTVTPLRTPAGGAVITHNDITQRKESEMLLASLRSELQRTLEWQLARQTAAAIAHELNQPLTVVTTCGEAAKIFAGDSGALPPKLRLAIDKMVSNAEQAGLVMRKLLEQFDHKQPSTQTFEARPLIEEVAILATTGNEDAPKIFLKMPSGSIHLKADRLQIEKILMNLLHNGREALAGCIARPGQNSLKVSLEHDSKMARISVEDSGLGLLGTNEVEIFDPLFTTKPHGIGMGLTISKALAEANGGKLWYQARPEGGSIFHLTLPLANQEAQA